MSASKPKRRKSSSVKKLTISVLGIPHVVTIRPFKDEDDSVTSFGEADITTGEIFINSLHPSDRQIKTLVHEILEVLNEHLELGLNHKQITQLETGLYTSLDGIGQFIALVS